jgi:hypothetical protein
MGDRAHVAKVLELPVVGIGGAPARIQALTVTRRNVAGMDVVPGVGLWFWLSKSATNSFCKSAARPFLSAASNAFMVGP